MFYPSGNATSAPAAPTTDNPLKTDLPMLFALSAVLRRTCALLCLLIFAFSAWATPTSPLRFKRLGSLDSDELSILALMQDRQGFIWIGTHSGGLYRYNGYHAVKYTSSIEDPASLPHDRVSTLFEDKQGVIWAGTQNGLARYNPKTNDFTRFLPPPGPSAQRIVKSIISDGKDGMWHPSRTTKPALLPHRQGDKAS